jgi:hypothetical protein
MNCEFTPCDSASVKAPTLLCFRIFLQYVFKNNTMSKAVFGRQTVDHISETQNINIWITEFPDVVHCLILRKETTFQNSELFPYSGDKNLILGAYIDVGD